MNAKEMVRFAAQLLDEKKAEDIVVLDIEGVTALGDYFLIASGGSSTQVKALAEEVEEKFSELGIEPRRIEGDRSANWLLLDYSDVIVHIFYRETRDFYCLERLWGDAARVDWQTL